MEQCEAETKAIKDEASMSHQMAEDRAQSEAEPATRERRDKTKVRSRRRTREHAFDGWLEEQAQKKEKAQKDVDVQEFPAPSKSKDVSRTASDLDSSVTSDMSLAGVSPALEHKFTLDYAHYLSTYDTTCMQFMALLLPLRLRQISRQTVVSAERLTEAIFWLLVASLALCAALVFASFRFRSHARGSSQSAHFMREVGLTMLVGVLWPLAKYHIARELAPQIHAPQRALILAIGVGAFPGVWKHSWFRKVSYAGTVVSLDWHTLGPCTSLLTLLPALAVAAALRWQEASYRRVYKEKFQKCGVWWDTESVDTSTKSGNLLDLTHYQRVLGLGPVAPPLSTPAKVKGVPIKAGCGDDDKLMEETPATAQEPKSAAKKAAGAWSSTQALLSILGPALGVDAILLRTSKASLAWLLGWRSKGLRHAWQEAWRTWSACCPARPVPAGEGAQAMRRCEAAAVEGDLEALRRAREEGGAWDVLTSALAAEHGHLEVLVWAVQNGCPWDEDVCSSAARAGHLEVLQWAVMNGCPWNVLTGLYAAHAGHLEVVQWCGMNGLLVDGDWVCAAAAGGGQLPVLEWLWAHGCPWDERTCASAAAAGQLAVLQWVRAAGCPWDETTCTEATNCGQLEVLEWAISAGCPYIVESM